MLRLSKKSLMNMVCILGRGPSCGTNGYTQHRLHSFKIHVRIQELGLRGSMLLPDPPRL